MRFFCLLAILASALPARAASAAPGPWEQPAAALAEQVATILGPGQAHLTLRNNSTVSTDELPAIRRLLEQDLRSHGIQASGMESANSIHITLSENLHGRLWIAEAVEGNETRVTMVRVEPAAAQQQSPAGGLSLRKQVMLTINEPVLAALEISDSMVLVGPEEIVVLSNGANGWQPQKRVAIGQHKPLSRDPRAIIVPSADGQSFETSVGAMACAGTFQQADWTIRCHESDDPWLLAESSPVSASSASDTSLRLRAFYNSARDSFTGVVTPSVGIDLPPFYDAVLLPRADGAGLLLNGVDGKMQLAESGAIKTITGTRDWGSDFALLHSGCGVGSQVIASSSGEAIADSLRAYELPALEAVPAGDPLAMGGAVTALYTSLDSKSVLAIVRKPAAPGHADPYEVDRVTATCN